MSRKPSKLIFEICSDYERFPDQWFLTEPLTATGEEIDAREFTEGVPYRGPTPVAVPIRNPGKEVAFHFGAFEMPVVSRGVVETIALIACNDVETFPIDIPTAKGEYSILNAICLLDCLDESRSEFTRWEESDHRPDRLGQYHMISTIRIDPERTHNHHMFRIENWPFALLVSGKLKDALEDIPNLGVVFEPAV